VTRSVERLVKSGRKKKGATLLATADALCGQLVRARGMCEVDGCDARTDLQWAHGFSRSYRKIRHDLRNGFCLCRSHHMGFTVNPIAWDDWLRAKWGDAQYAQMRFLALSGPRANLKETVARLREEIDMRLGT
jgi:hypothetical protein